jgi:hypothetical protein
LRRIVAIPDDVRLPLERVVDRPGHDDLDDAVGGARENLRR